MDRFIYVFDEATRNEMLKNGFEMIQSDEKKRVYVFLNRPEILFTLNGIASVRTNMISL